MQHCKPEVNRSFRRDENDIMAIRFRYGRGHRSGRLSIWKYAKFVIQTYPTRIFRLRFLAFGTIIYDMSKPLPNLSSWAY